MTDFEIMAYMSKNEMDIRMSPHFVETKTTKQGGVVTMGVDAQTVMGIFTGTIQPALYCLNKEQFFGIKEGKIPAEVSPINLALPTDEETELWFEENIGNEDCSASSAVYKFRLWLKERIK